MDKKEESEYSRMFCEKCKARLTRNIIGNDLLFLCSICKTTRSTVDTDTLLYTEVKSEKINMNSSIILDNIFDDPTNLKVKGTCIDPSCSGNILVQIRYNIETMKLISGCMKCKKKWF